MDTDLGEIRGHVIVVMAPMGSGKGTIVRHALAKYPELRQTVSGTSRAMRPGEVDGQHYHFLSNAEFEQKIAAGEFLEWAEFAGNKYGTLKSEILPRILECDVVIVEIELQGVEQLLDLLPREHLTIVYIEAGGWEVLRARAESRAPMSAAELAARHERYLIEVQAKPIADIVIDNTGDINAATAAFDQVIEEAYKKCK
ncbi:guanylate kinase [Candidatus Kaiserbacteria bacterium]|nr:guanylate kinase [Candidatus Kaiserbacteria bacterium]MCB9812246.1 guanylate kinase [Candidatus Nomurabacteria bacterium]